MKYVEVKLDKERKFRFTSNTFSDLQAELKAPLGVILKPIMQAAEGNDAYSAIDIALFRGLLWAGLRWEDPTLTVKVAGDLMDEAMEDGIWDQVTEKLFKALSMSGFFMQLKAKGETSTSGSKVTNNSAMTQD